MAKSGSSKNAASNLRMRAAFCSHSVITSPGRSSSSCSTTAPSSGISSAHDSMDPLSKRSAAELLELSSSKSPVSGETTSSSTASVGASAMACCRTSVLLTSANVGSASGWSCPLNHSPQLVAPACCAPPSVPADAADALGRIVPVPTCKSDSTAQSASTSDLPSRLQPDEVFRNSQAPSPCPKDSATMFPDRSSSTIRTASDPANAR